MGYAIYISPLNKTGYLSLQRSRTICTNRSAVLLLQRVVVRLMKIFAQHFTLLSICIRMDELDRCRFRKLHRVYILLGFWFQIK